MNKFTQEFYKLSEDGRRLKVESLVIDKKNGTATICFIGLPEYLDGLSESSREKVRQISERILETFLKVETTFKKAHADVEDLKTKILDFLNSEYPAVVIGIGPNDINVEIDPEKSLISIKIGLDEYMKEFAEKAALNGAIERFLERKFIEASRVEFFIDNNPRAEYKTASAAFSFVRRDETITVTDVERVYGKTILSYPKPIKTISGESDNAVLCGKIGHIDRRVSKAGNTFYTFELADKTGRIAAKIFPKKRNVDYNNKFDEMSGQADIREDKTFKPSSKKSATDVLDTLRDNEEIVACGSIRNDAYTKDVSFWINDINRCKIEYPESEDEVFNEAGEEYLTVTPQAYIKTVQQDFFSEEPSRPPFLLGKSFVVFDCETTGLDKYNDQIIELAAVKIENGILTETFSTFVNPGSKLPQKITELTGITDGDLKDAPKITEIFHDFYKFTKGCALVAHNIEFDIEFIRRAAKLTGFKIDNDTYDTMTIARKKFSVQNYKLGTLCEYFNIDLTGAHRAVNDAVATAELFIKLAEKNAL
jgi:DNA polymerase III epsilon subunit family exonuclease